MQFFTRIYNMDFIMQNKIVKTIGGGRYNAGQHPAIQNFRLFILKVRNSLTFG